MKNQATLLLVDDDRHVLGSMADWLREQGYKVDTALTLAEGTAAVDRKTYDLALVDIRLGDDDGFDLLAHCGRSGRTRPSSCSPATAPSRRPSRRSATARSISSPSR